RLRRRGPGHFRATGPGLPVPDGDADLRVAALDAPLDRRHRPARRQEADAPQLPFRPQRRRAVTLGNGTAHLLQMIVTGPAATAHPAQLVRRADRAAAADSDGLRLAAGEGAQDDVIRVEQTQRRPLLPGRPEAVAGVLLERLDAPADDAD